MCGRYGFIHSPEDLQQAWGGFRVHGAFPPSYNRAPGQRHPVLRQAPDLRLELVPMRWGFLPGWSTRTQIRPINARVETVATQPLFREAFRLRRAVIPADWYFEWPFIPEDPSEKQPVLIRARDQSILGLAGIWDRHKGTEGQTEETFAILTVPATPTLQSVHPRMPLVLNPQHWALWWHPHAQRKHLEPCLQPAATLWESFPVTPKVNSPRFDEPEAILPWDGTPPA